MRDCRRAAFSSHARRRRRGQMEHSTGGDGAARVLANTWAMAAPPDSCLAPRSHVPRNPHNLFPPKQKQRNALHTYTHTHRERGGRPRFLSQHHDHLYGRTRTFSLFRDRTRSICDTQTQAAISHASCPNTTRRINTLKLSGSWMASCERTLRLSLTLCCTRPFINLL